MADMPRIAARAEDSLDADRSGVDGSLINMHRGRSLRRCLSRDEDGRPYPGREGNMRHDEARSGWR